MYSTEYIAKQPWKCTFVSNDQINKIIIMSKIRLTILNSAQNTYENFTDKSHELWSILKHTAIHFTFTRRDESQTETHPYLQFKFK